MHKLAFVWVGLRPKKNKKQPRSLLVRSNRKKRLKMAEMDWVEQLKRFNASHAKDKASELDNLKFYLTYCVPACFMLVVCVL